MARYRFTQVRLLVADDLAAGATLRLGRDQAHYLGTVMRLAPGAELLVFNGRDGEWTARIAALDKKRGTLTVGECLRPQPAAGSLTYCFAPLKHARLDYLVQKATEMGAARLQPVFTQHGQVNRINGQRMRANVVEACEQCGVLAIPEVLAPLPLAEFLERWSAANRDGRILFCDEAATETDPLEVLAGVAPGPLALLVGPEGGFSEAERSLLTGRDDVTALALGPRILRADTAAVAALALVQAVLGDWRPCSR